LGAEADAGYADSGSAVVPDFNYNRRHIGAGNRHEAGVGGFMS